MADEPLREIHLNGKQLVFLFMSATVVAVVIFLSGVMVGRGVPSSERNSAGLVDAPLDPTLDPTIEPATAAGGAGAGLPGMPVTAGEHLDYGRALVENETAADDLLPLSEPMPPNSGRLTESSPDPSPARTPTAVLASTPVSTSAQSGGESRLPSVPAEPAGKGFVVQVLATPERSEADAVARRLAGKGYPAFVTTTTTGPLRFRVRVGKYDQRREAVNVASKLEREEQFKPWVTD